MRNKVAIIARYTFVEATQNRLFRLTLVGLICLFGIAEFAGELAITETREIQAAMLATIARWFLVMTAALFVITSMVRELNDKGTGLILSLPISRTSYYLGKYLGFLALSLVIAASISLLLLLYTEPAWLVIWFISLMCELTIIIAISMLCLFTFSNITVAFIAVIAFYIVSRSMEAIRLLSISPILESENFSQAFMTWVVNGIAYLLPSLDRYSDSAWLAYGADINVLYTVISQTLIYLALLIAAGLFDLSRKEL